DKGGNVSNVNADDGFAIRKPYCQGIVDFQCPFVIDRKCVCVTIIGSRGVMDPWNESFGSSDEFRGKVFSYPGHHQKSVDGRTASAGTREYVVSSLAYPRGPGHVFENRTDFVAGFVPQPVLNSIEYGLGAGRDGIVFAVQQLPDDVRQLLALFFP